MPDKYVIYKALSAQLPMSYPEDQLPDMLRCGYCGARLVIESEWERGFCCPEHEAGEPRA